MITPASPLRDVIEHAQENVRIIEERLDAMRSAVVELARIAAAHEAPLDASLDEIVQRLAHVQAQRFRDLVAVAINHPNTNGGNTNE